MDGRAFLIILVIGVVSALMIPAVSDAAAVRWEDISGTKLEHKIEKRQADSYDTSNLATKLGAQVVQRSADARIRRDHHGGEVKQHMEKAEVDAIAAAQESSLAGKHALDSVVESLEAEQGLGEDASFEENDAGDLVRVPQSSGGHGHAGQGQSRLQHEMGTLGLGHDEIHHAPTPDSEFVHVADVERLPNAESMSSNQMAGFDHESELRSHGHHDVDVETPLRTLLTQSKDLAKETQLVFQVIARREDVLVNEMESFKKALQDAINVLQETASVNKARLKRWDNGNFEPYKACVYVSPQDQAPTRYVPPQRLVQEPPEPVEEPPPPPPPEPEPEPEPMPRSNAAAQTQYQPSGDDIDLSSIYWLKLPQNEDESSLEKVQRVLGEVRQSGRDMLLIPVLKGFTDANDLARGFLKAVRVNPATQSQSSSKKRKFRLRIRRLL